MLMVGNESRKASAGGIGQRLKNCNWLVELAKGCLHENPFSAISDSHSMGPGHSHNPTAFTHLVNCHELAACTARTLGSSCALFMHGR